MQISPKKIERYANSRISINYNPRACFGARKGILQSIALRALCKIQLSGQIAKLKNLFAG
jgi:hypothetical protein